MNDSKISIYTCDRQKDCATRTTCGTVCFCTADINHALYGELTPSELLDRLSAIKVTDEGTRHRMADDLMLEALRQNGYGLAVDYFTGMIKHY